MANHEPSRCMICLDNLNKDRPIRQIRCTCKLKVHRECFYKLLSNNTFGDIKCPHCRNSIICNDERIITKKINFREPFVLFLDLPASSCYLRCLVSVSHLIKTTDPYNEIIQKVSTGYLWLNARPKAFTCDWGGAWPRTLLDILNGSRRIQLKFERKGDCLGITEIELNYTNIKIIKVSDNYYF